MPGRAVPQVERLSGGHLRVHVHEDDLADDSTKLKGECGVGADAAPATDDADFHGFRLLRGRSPPTIMTPRQGFVPVPTAARVARTTRHFNVLKPHNGRVL